MNRSGVPLKLGKAWQGEDALHINKDGLMYWASSRVLPILDERYQITGLYQPVTGFHQQEVIGNR